MSRNLRIAYFAHSVRSDWNNGNAHFLRGLLRCLGEAGHAVRIFEPANGWSYENLQSEPQGEQALRQFSTTYPGLHVTTYDLSPGSEIELLPGALQNTDIVIVHEWNPPELTNRLLAYRDALGFRLLFHDTHHRASSSPEQIRLLGVDRFDGVVVFGEALRRIYCQRFGITRVLTLHEAADTDVFYPRLGVRKTEDAVWIGNWGDGERSAEIREFLLQPVAALHARLPHIRRALSRRRARGIAPGRRSLRRLPAQSRRAGSVCQRKAHGAYSAPAIRRGDGWHPDDPRI